MVGGGGVIFDKADPVADAIAASDRMADDAVAAAESAARVLELAVPAGGRPASPDVLRGALVRAHEDANTAAQAAIAASAAWAAARGRLG